MRRFPLSRVVFAKGVLGTSGNTRERCSSLFREGLLHSPLGAKRDDRVPHICFAILSLYQPLTSLRSSEADVIHDIRTRSVQRQSRGCGHHLHRILACRIGGHADWGCSIGICEAVADRSARQCQLSRKIGVRGRIGFDLRSRTAGAEARSHDRFGRGDRAGCRYAVIQMRISCQRRTRAGQRNIPACQPGNAA